MLQHSGSQDTSGHATPLEAAATRASAKDKLRPLLARMGRGDQHALAELYDRTAGRIHALALRYVRDPHCAEEIVSDVYLQAWSDSASYKAARGCVLAWLLMITRSRAIDALRRRRRSPFFTSDAALPDRADESAPEGLAVLEALERGHAIAAAIACVTPLQRQLIALAYFQGLTHHEIARQQRISLGTVKSNFRRAMSTMRLSLGVDTCSRLPRPIGGRRAPAAPERRPPLDRGNVARARKA